MSASSQRGARPKTGAGITRLYSSESRTKDMKTLVHSFPFLIRLRIVRARGSLSVPSAVAARKEGRAAEFVHLLRRFAAASVVVVIRTALIGALTVTKRHWAACVEQSRFDNDCAWASTQGERCELLRVSPRRSPQHLPGPLFLLHPRDGRGIGAAVLLPNGPCVRCEPLARRTHVVPLSGWHGTPACAPIR